MYTFDAEKTRDALVALIRQTAEKQGFARVLDEDEMTAESMKKEIFALYENKEKYVSAMAQAASGDGVEAVMTQIRVLMG